MSGAAGPDTGPPAMTGLTRMAFALSGVTVGVISTGLNFFLLVYYDQVVGLQAALAGLALAIALCVDAVSDPLVGYISDRWRSPSGRRHPFLYASLLPMAGAYIAVWFPPWGADNQVALFLYLLATSVLIRLSLTLFDVPGNALIPELTRDYDERTRLATFKVTVSWMSANLMGIGMYAVWLRDSGTVGSGILNAAGYQSGGLFFGGVILVAAAAFALLLRPAVPYLAAVSAAVKPADGPGAFRSLRQTYANRSILALLGTATLLASAMGLTQALWIYFMSFFWGLGSAQVNAVQVVYLCAAVTALLLLPRLGRGRDKRTLALQVTAAFWLIDVTPYALRLVGAFPETGSPALLPALLVYSYIDGLTFNMMIALVLSMLADVVEENLLATGRREEGAVLAGQTLVTKASTALGTMLGAFLLTAVAFPQAPGPDGVPAAVLFDLGVAYVAVMWTLAILSLACLARYRITRSGHQENVDRLRALD